jgi:hypothetical protein
LGERAEGKAAFDFKKFYLRINTETGSLDFLKAPKNKARQHSHFFRSCKPIHTPSAIVYCGLGVGVM